MEIRYDNNSLPRRVATHQLLQGHTYISTGAYERMKHRITDVFLLLATEPEKDSVFCRLICIENGKVWSPHGDDNNGYFYEVDTEVHCKGIKK